MSNKKSKRKQIAPKSWESLGTGKIPGTALNECFLTIYESMLRSEAYKALTIRQRHLYIICKAQWYGKRKPSADYPDLGFENECFYLHRNQVINDYALYTIHTARFFYEDMRALIAYGFIELVSNGKANHTKNIYRFSSRWKFINHEQITQIAAEIKKIGIKNYCANHKIN